MIGWQTIGVWMVAVTLATPPVPERHIGVDGLVRLIEHVDVPARRDGRLEKINVKEGAYIHRGDPLGRLDDAEAQLTLKRTELEHQLAVEKANSEIALNSARLIQEVTNNEFQRARLAKQSAPSSISLTEFDRLRLEAEKATNELARLTEEKRFAGLASQSKAVELQLARLALDERQIVSPLDGIVVQLHRREGERLRESTLGSCGCEREAKRSAAVSRCNVEKEPTVLVREADPERSLRRVHGSFVERRLEAEGFVSRQGFNPRLQLAQLGCCRALLGDRRRLHFRRCLLRCVLLGHPLCGHLASIASVSEKVARPSLTEFSSREPIFVR